MVGCYATTIAAGTGGEVSATSPKEFILNLATDEVEWHEPVLLMRATT